MTRLSEERMEEIKELMKPRQPIRGTAATYRKGKELVCDLVELAKIYSSGLQNIPERVCFARAAEIALLSRAFLVLEKKYRRDSK